MDISNKYPPIIGARIQPIFPAILTIENPSRNLSSGIQSAMAACTTGWNIAENIYIKAISIKLNILWYLDISRMDNMIRNNALPSNDSKITFLICYHLVINLGMHFFFNS